MSKARGKIRYKVIADFLLFLHVLWVALLVGGTVFMIYNRWYVVYHLIIVGGTLLFNLFLGGCPLTWWEEKYRKKWDPDAVYYQNSFAVTYARKIFGVNVTLRQVNWALILIKITSCYIATVLLVLRRYL
jgi:hypothetical protein